MEKGIESRGGVKLYCWRLSYLWCYADIAALLNPLATHSKVSNTWLQYFLFLTIYYYCILSALLLFSISTLLLNYYCCSFDMPARTAYMVAIVSKIESLSVSVCVFLMLYRIIVYFNSFKRKAHYRLAGNFFDYRIPFQAHDFWTRLLYPSFLSFKEIYEDPLIYIVWILSFFFSNSSFPSLSLSRFLPFPSFTFLLFWFKQIYSPLRNLLKSFSYKLPRPLLSFLRIWKLGRKLFVSTPPSLSLSFLSFCLLKF